MLKKYFIHELMQKNIIKYGDFTLKSGLKTNIYFDLRSLISYPLILNQIQNDLHDNIISKLQFDSICGLAYSGIPIASGISSKYICPMLIVRKERKDYGTKKLIEGNYHQDDVCLLIDDVMTTGSSINENIKILREAGIKVNDVVVILDRRENNDEIDGCKVHSLYKMKDLENDIKLYHKLCSRFEIGSMAYKLATVMYQKETNLILSADVTTKKELLELVELAGSHICILKTHIDIIQDFDDDLIYQIKKLSKKYGFMIMEDKKFADIGNTVYHQYTGGIYKIIDWADFITVHSVMGYSTFKSLNRAIREHNLEGKRGIFILAGASSDNNLITEGYFIKTLQIAHSNAKIVSGFISQENICGITEFFYATPGVNIEVKGDKEGQTYNTPEIVVSRGSDLIIVGRGIYQASNKVEALNEYRERGWKALIMR